MGPLFSIGVVTYDRRELLKDCIASILNQSFANFEVIISNDFVGEALSLEALGIDDPRVRLVNQPVNLGPWQNHNFTLRESRGRYFAWLSDDDLMANNFLEMMHDALEAYDFPKRIFSDYRSGLSVEDIDGFTGKGPVRELSGAEFVGGYVSRGIRTIGHYGVFEREYLFTLGGLENLGTGIYSPYNDNLLAIRSGLLDKIIYINAALVFFRTHESSSSAAQIDIDDFISAQSEFLERAVVVLQDSAFESRQSENIFHLLTWCVGDLFAVVQRNKVICSKALIEQLFVLNRYALKTGWRYWKFLWMVAHATASFAYLTIKTSVHRFILDGSK